jgi:hypothetical protein
LDNSEENIDPQAVHMLDFSGAEIDTSSAIEDEVIRPNAPGADAPGAEAPAAAALGPDGKPIIEIMSFEAFYHAFKFSFILPQLVSKDFAPLEITDDEETQARTTAEVFYNAFLQHFPRALQVKYENAMQYAVAGQFTLGKIMLAANIMRMKKLERMQGSFAPGPAAPGPAAPGPAAPGPANQNRTPSPMAWMDAERAG